MAPATYMALSGINRKRHPWSVKTRFPNVGDCQGVEVRVGGWEGEHLYGRMGEGAKGITFEMEIHKISNKNKNK